MRPTDQGARIWPLSDDQQAEGGTEVLGPARAEITVRHEPALSPYDLDLLVHLVDGRYLASSLTVLGMYERPDYATQVERASQGEALPPSAFEENPPELDPITSRGLAAIKLSSILEQALRGQCTVRRHTTDGRIVTGVGAEDELPVVYCLARAVGEHPTLAVASYFKIGRSAAAQRVSRARQAGLIPPSSQGGR